MHGYFIHATVVVINTTEAKEYDDDADNWKNPAMITVTGSYSCVRHATLRHSGAKKHKMLQVTTECRGRTAGYI